MQQRLVHRLGRGAGGAAELVAEQAARTRVDQKRLPDVAFSATSTFTHASGPIHVPINSVLDDRGRFSETAALRRVFADLDLSGHTSIVTYCTIGGRASTAWFVLTHLLGRSHVAVPFRAPPRFPLDGRCHCLGRCRSIPWAQLGPPGGVDHLSPASGADSAAGAARQPAGGRPEKLGGRLLRLPQKGRRSDTISCARAMSCAIPVGLWARPR